MEVWSPRGRVGVAKELTEAVGSPAEGDVLGLGPIGDGVHGDEIEGLGQSQLNRSTSVPVSYTHLTLPTKRIV